MDNLFFELATSLINLVRPVLTALSPLITGLIIAYLLSPVVSSLERRVKSRGLSIIITYILVICVTGALACGFVILITGALPHGDLAATAGAVNDYIMDAVSAVSSFIEKNIPLAGPDVSQDMAVRLQNWFSARFSLNSLTRFISSVTGGIISFFVGVVASVYLLKDKEFFVRLWENFLSLVLSQRSHGLLCEIMSQINTVITTFIKGALIDSIIVAFLSSLVLTLLRVDFAVITGVLSGILNIIPYFGPFISMIPAFLTALFSGGLLHGIAAAAGLLAVQQLDSNYIYPKIVGTTIGLHPLLVLLAVSISGFFFGIAGMLLAVPAAGIIQVLVTRWACSKS